MPERPDFSGEVTAVIPVKNEVETLPGVIAAVREYIPDVLVVDGNSTDGSREAAEAAGAQVIVEQARGKGAAIRQAMESVTTPVALLMDADGSHDPSEIPALLAPISAGTADLVLGSRMRGGSDELHGTVSEAIRLFGNVTLTLWINLALGVRLTDVQNGFRAIRTDVFRQLGITATGFTIEQEMAILAIRKGYLVCEVPTHELRRGGGRSKLSVMRDGPSFLFNIARRLYGPCP